MQPRDGLVERLVDDIGCDRAAGFGQVAEALGTLLDELSVVVGQLVQQDGNQLVDVVDDLGLARDAKNLV